MRERILPVMRYLRLDRGSRWRNSAVTVLRSSNRAAAEAIWAGCHPATPVSGASRPGLGPARLGVDGVQLPIAFEAFQGVRAAVGKGDS